MQGDVTDAREEIVVCPWEDYKGLMKRVTQGLKGLSRLPWSHLVKDTTKSRRRIAKLQAIEGVSMHIAAKEDSMFLINK